MSYAVWLAPEIRRSTRRRHRPPVSQPRLPRDSTGVGALKHKAEIVTHGQRGAEGRGHAHLGGVLVGFSLHVCGNGLWELTLVCSPGFP
jgi:hypothetical protein